MNDIATLHPAEAGVPLTAKQLISRLALIQDVMKNVMKEGQDFGTIPGTPKPTLYKPGAEKLCVTFRLAPDDPIIESVPELSGDIRYRVRVPLRASDGSLVAVGVGECSTGEEKYHWRRPVHDSEFQSAPEDQRRQKWTRDGDLWNQVRVNPADVANTVLKMAHKRAYVHVVIMATAAGAIFTQDIEDLPDGVGADDGSPQPASTKPAQPQRKENKPVAGGGAAVTFKVKDITKKEGQGERGPWTKFTVVAVDGQRYGTFDTELHRIAREAMQHETALDATYTETKYGRDLQSLAHANPSPAAREPGAEG